MGLLTTLLTLPISGPVRGAMWVAEKIHEAALSEFHDPRAIKAALTDLERALDAGEIDDDAYEAAESELLDRLEAAQAARRGKP